MNTDKSVFIRVDLWLLPVRAAASGVRVGVRIRIVICVRVRVCGLDLQHVLHAGDTVNSFRNLFSFGFLGCTGHRARKRNHGFVDVDVDRGIAEVVCRREIEPRLHPQPAIIYAGTDGAA